MLRSLSLCSLSLLIACSPNVSTCEHESCMPPTFCDPGTRLCVRRSEDAGRPVPDSGMAEVDAGQTSEDAGSVSPLEDAGTIADAGTSDDAGTIVDAGQPSDAGACPAWYRDGDNDGFGAPGQLTLSCQPLAGHVATATDCDDSNHLVSPAAPESCDTSFIDENCDGRVNEDCRCTIGSTQPCCSGRGVQVCELSDGGATFSACNAAVSTERCNGLDDDCNSLIDDLPLFDGGVPVDGGQVGVSCTVGVGACERTARDTCSMGTLFCPVDAGVPTTEVCNGLDDDCNGLTDESSNLCSAIAGQSCVSGTCGCAPGQTVCGTSCQTLGGTCSRGVGACLRTGANRCSATGQVECDATAGGPSAEICNGVDDNCNGSTDEAGAGLCPASGQTCSGGSCACPSGQQVCGSACVTLGTSCAVGVGACRRTGTHVCSNSAVTCGATAGQPSAEVCNGVDDDCNGSIDEPPENLCFVGGQTCSNGACTCPANTLVCNFRCTIPVRCLVDADGDEFAAAQQVVLQCPSATGFCPGGFVAEAHNLGIDCDDTNPNLYQLGSVRADQDADTSCVGPTMTACVGQSTAPAGRRLAASCQPTDDCFDQNAAFFRFAQIAADNDGDGYCGSSQTACIGANPPSGYRLSSSCVSNTDCNDFDGSTYRTMSLRADADGDQFCVGAPFTACIGAAPPAGRRIASTCAGDDCRDINFQATTVCSIPWASTSATKSCGIGPPPTETFSVSAAQPSQFGCPFGFQLSGSFNTERTGALTGICNANGSNSVSMTCPGGGFGSFTCRVTGSCEAQ